MRNYFSKLLKGIFIIAVFALLGAGCATTSPVSETIKPKVAASIFPVYDLVRTVAGNDVDVELIIAPGASPHYFEPTTRQLRDLQGTQRMFTIGAGFDRWAQRIASNIDSARVVDLSSGVSLRPSVDPHEEEIHNESEEGAEEEFDEDHGARDPHYWLSPANALLMIDSIEEELRAVSPENADAFTQRADALKTAIRARDAQWKQRIAALPTKEIVTFHDAFMYLADHFGLDVIATFEPFPGKAPTPRYLANLREEIREHGITHLFLEPQLSADALQSFARDNTITLGVLDPIGGVEGRQSYIELIDYNISQIVESLQD